MNGHLVKPVSREKLLNMIHKILKNNKERRQRGRLRWRFLYNITIVFLILQKIGSCSIAGMIFLSRSSVRSRRLEVLMQGWQPIYFPLSTSSSIRSCTRFFIVIHKSQHAHGARRDIQKLFHISIFCERESCRADL